MKATLKTRVKALENALPSHSPEEDEAVRRFRQVAGERLRQRLEDTRTGRLEKEYAALDAAGRLRHWQKKIDDACETIRNQGKRPDDDLARRASGAIGFDAMVVLRLKSAESCLPDYRWHLAAAQLDCLQDIGYSSPEIEAFKQEHGRYAGIPSQWHGPELPADAARMIGEVTP